MVSRLRMKLDLLVQGISFSALALVAFVEPLRTTLIAALLVLASIQLTSAAQLWWWHSYRPARVYLYLFLFVAVLLPVGLYFFNFFAWSGLMVLTIVYFLHTLYAAKVVLRRPRSFWDIT